MTNNKQARTTATFATFVVSLTNTAQKSSQPNLWQDILVLRIPDRAVPISIPARRVLAYRIRNRRTYRKGMPMYKVITLKDKTIPSRKQRQEREEVQSTKVLIREALRAGNASKYIVEEDSRG